MNTINAQPFSYYGIVLSKTEGALDMPSRLGDTVYDWGDYIQPLVGALDIFWQSKTIALDVFFDGPRYGMALSEGMDLLKALPDGFVLETNHGTFTVKLKEAIVSKRFSTDRAMLKLVFIENVPDFSGISLEGLGGPTVTVTLSNLLLYSNDKTNAVWIKENIDISGDKIIGSFSETSQTHNLIQNVAKAASVINYTLSYYVEAAEYGRIGVFVEHFGSPDFVYRYFDASVGSFYGGSGGFGNFTLNASGFSDEGDGWYRAHINFTTFTETSLKLSFVMVNGGTTDFAGDGVSGINLKNIQLQEGDLTTYIETLDAPEEEEVEEPVEISYTIQDILIDGFGLEKIFGILVSGVHFIDGIPSLKPSNATVSNTSVPLGTYRSLNTIEILCAKVFTDFEELVETMDKFKKLLSLEGQRVLKYKGIEHNCFITEGFAVRLFKNHIKFNVKLQTTETLEE